MRLLLDVVLLATNNDIPVSIFLRPEPLLQKENLGQAFAANFKKFLLTPFIEHVRWLLLFRIDILWYRREKASFFQRFYMLVQVYLPSMFRTCAVETL